VFLIRRRQADAPNHCSHWLNIYSIYFYGHPVAAMPFAVIRRASGHCKGFVVCHTACSSSSFALAATVSNRSTSFIRSSLRSIPPRSYHHNLLQGMVPLPNSQSINTSGSHAFSQTNATILTGFHFASFVATSFQSCSVHPLPIIWLAGIPTFGCA
jgi:hypothetical protein